MQFRLRTLLIVLAVGPMVPNSAKLHAQDQKFDAAAVVRVAVEILDREHFCRRPLDDERAKRWFDAFLAALDPMRMYFLKTDVEEFRQYAVQLDDLAKGGDFRFPEIVRLRYRERTAQAAELAKKFLKTEPSFSADEVFPRHFDQYAANPEELENRWRLRIKFEQLIEKPGGRPMDQVRTQLRGRYSRIAKSAQEMTDARLCQIYLDALVKCYDPHSAYYGPDINFTFDFSHIRARSLGLRLDQRRGRIVILGIHSAIQNSDTQRLVGWELLAIKRIDGSTFDLVEIPFEEVHKMIMHVTGSLDNDSEVVLELFNPTTSERRSLPWTR